MRYTRLRRAIESGTLIGTHGTPFQGGVDKILEAQKKRKRLQRHGRSEEGVEDHGLDMIQTRSGHVIDRKAKIGDDSTDGYDTETLTEDDESPPAKKREGALKREVKAEEETASPLPIGELTAIPFNGAQGPHLENESSQRDLETCQQVQDTAQSTNAPVKQACGIHEATGLGWAQESHLHVKDQPEEAPKVKSEMEAKPSTSLQPLYASSATVTSPDPAGAASKFSTISLKSEDEENERLTKPTLAPTSDQAGGEGFTVVQDRKPSKHLLDSEQESKAPRSLMVPI